MHQLFFDDVAGVSCDFELSGGFVDVMGLGTLLGNVLGYFSCGAVEDESSTDGGGGFDSESVGSEVDRLGVEVGFYVMFFFVGEAAFRAADEDDCVWVLV